MEALVGNKFVAHWTCADFLPQEIATTVAEEAFEEECADRPQTVNYYFSFLYRRSGKRQQPDQLHCIESHVYARL